MKKTSVSVCTYHRTFEGDGLKTILNFKNQNFDNFYVLFDNQLNLIHEEVSTKYNNSNISFYNDEDFKFYGFNKPISKFHWWGNHQNPKYFYAHFRMLIHYIKNPNFDYYWYFDDDVQFTGDLKTFLENYNTINDDFLAIQVFKKENYLEFPNVDVINERMNGSKGKWLDYCPGHEDNFKNLDRHMGSFFPITRFSNKAFEHLLKLHNEGYYGYSEGFVPTSLASDGFKVSSMLNEYNNYYLKNVDCEIIHKGQKFTWEWL